MFWNQCAGGFIFLRGGCINRICINGVRMSKGYTVGCCTFGAYISGSCAYRVCARCFDLCRCLRLLMPRYTGIPCQQKQKTDKLYFSIIITPLGFVCQRYFFLNLAPIKSLFYAVCWIYISCALDIYALRVGYISPVRWTYISCMLGYYTLHER